MKYKESHIPKGILYFIMTAIILISGCRNIFAQVLNLEFENYNYHHGLSQNHIHSIAQDKRGFMWFGTDDGLCRFDGHEFKIYKSDEHDPHSLANNSVRALLVDDDGTILIGTNKGICRFYPEKERFEHFDADFKDPGKLNGIFVREIKKDRKGNLFIAYEGSGLDMVSSEGKIKHFSVRSPQASHRFKNDLVRSIAFHPDGSTVIGTSKGIEFLSKNGKLLSGKEALSLYPWSREFDDVSIRTIFFTKDNRYVWIGTDVKGLFSIDLYTNKLTLFNKDNSPLDFNFIISISEDSKGNVWIGSEALYLYDVKKNNIVLYNEFGIQGNMVVKNPIHSFYEDRDNNIWIGTARMGVLKYSPFNTKILQYNTNQGIGKVKSNEILAFKEDEQGQVWIGTGVGLFRFREDLKGFDESSVSPNLKSKVIKYIHRDKNGYFWLGTWFDGLLKYHPIKNTYEEFAPRIGNFKSWHVWDIKEDSLGNLWLSTLRDGLCYFHTKTGKYEYIRHIPGDSSSLIHDDVVSTFIDSRNILWVGTGHGLSVQYPGSKKFINLYYEKGSLPANVIHTFYEDPNGKMWLGTGGGGIVILNDDLSVHKKITTRDGLPSNNVTAILSDENKNIWISSYNGLAKINFENFSVIEVPQISGLHGREYLAQASYRSKDGKLFFGGVNGFNLFHPDSLEFNRGKTDVYFTSLKIFDQEILPGKVYNGRKILNQSITDTDEISLSYEDYSFTLSFAPLTYNWQKSLKYAYIMENLDNEWHYTSSERRFVHYSNLSPGTYTLKVKASFDGKNWSDEARTLKIYIAPPWYGTYWFRFLSVICVGTIFFSIYRGRVNFLKRQSQKLEELVALRTMELKKSNEEIQDLLLELAEQKENVENKNDELQQINEELKAQHDVLELKSHELGRAQRKLQEINTNLEVLVKKRTQKLNYTVRELETLLYRASHDLRGPISSMLGLIAVAKMERSVELADIKYYNFLEDSVLKLERTLQKLLQKYTITKVKVSYELLMSSSILNLMEDVTKEIASFRPEDFELRIDEKLEFQSDAMLLSIMLTNLLENAFFYSSKAVNKKVFLDFVQMDNEVQITVGDFGAGIKKELKHKVFSMFYRGNEYSTGNGLGLYLVKNCIEKLGGSITFESEEGYFTRFIIRLPVHPPKVL